MKNRISKINLSLGMILLLLFIIAFQSASPIQTTIKTIITVDDEPGDADYTSIKEALNNSNTGDTIEVYSGTYKEDEISILKTNLNLNGLPYELGPGNDTGKPIIDAIGSNDAFSIYGDNVIINGFQIKTESNCGIVVYSNDTVLSLNTIETTDGVCILINGTQFGGKRNSIINNIFLNGNSTNSYGIKLEKTMYNVIAENDFLFKTNAYFVNSFKNTWALNYWQQPRVIPKLIFGKFVIITEIFSATFPWFNIDLSPAQTPNNS